MNINKYFDDLEFLEKIATGKYEINIQNQEIINILIDILLNRDTFNTLSNFKPTCDSLITLMSLIKNKSNNIECATNTLQKSCELLRLESIENTSFNIYYSPNKNLLDLNTIIKDCAYINKIEFKENQVYHKSNKLIDINIGILTREEHLITNNKFDIVLYVEDIYEMLLNNFKNNFINNSICYYDHYYLNKSIHKYENTENPIILLGNSYPMIAFNQNMLDDNFINFSIASQDIYYCLEILKFLSNKKKPKEVFLSICDFTLYHDVSKGNHERAYNLIENVYLPILNDTHNYDKEINSQKNYNFISSNHIVLKHLINNDAVIELLSKTLLDNQNYFNEFRAYKVCSTPTGIDNFKMNRKSKDFYSQQRVASHTKQKKYLNTNIENRCLLEEFVKVCNESNIPLRLVRFPLSSYYNDLHDKDMRNEILTFINELSTKYSFDFIDLFSNKHFNDFDFIDFDHLSEAGSVKSTRYILDYLNNKEGAYSTPFHY